MTRSTTFRNKNKKYSKAEDTNSNRTYVKILRVVIPPAFWLGAWQLASFLIGKELLLPAPLVVARTLGELALTPHFWQSAAATLGRVGAGFLSGVALGTVLAILCAVSRWASALLSPAVAVIRATPVASFIILLLLWVATGMVSAVCAALMVLPVVWGNVRKGIAQTDPLLLEAARVYRFSGRKILRLVYIPSVLPYFASGCATALGLAWKAGVAAEVLSLPRLAVGTQVYYSKLYLETPALFAWTAVILLLSFLLEKLFGALFRRMERGRAA